jgi:hypothetical protein
MERAVAFAGIVWQRIDARDQVREAAVACAVPDAAHKVYALGPVGNSMRMPMSMPSPLVAPAEPFRAHRADLRAVPARLQAELHRAFEVENAIHPGVT